MDMTQNFDDIGAVASDGNVKQYLTFILANEEYAVDILRVQEIKGWDIVTSLPNTPAYIKGVINLRGTIVPIIDLRERFDIENIDYGPTTVVIVLRVESDNGSRIMGVVVDAVSEVYNISDNDVRPPPDFGQAIATDFLEGLAVVDNKMIIILAIDHLINSSALISDVVAQ